jgi:hypothetical protein
MTDQTTAETTETHDPPEDSRNRWSVSAFLLVQSGITPPASNWSFFYIKAAVH